MKKNQLLFFASIFIVSCSVNNPTTNSIKSNNDQEYSFKIKSTIEGDDKDSSIIYRGGWNQVSSGSSFEGSYSESGVVENNSSDLKYLGNWTTTNEGAASGGNYANIDASSALYENTSSNISYSSGWVPEWTYNYAFANRTVITTIQDTDSQVTYSGQDWLTIVYGNGNSDKYNVSCSNPASCPSYYEITFTGNNIHLIGRRVADWGKIKVSIFDTNGNLEKFVDNIDLYNPNYLVNQTIFQIIGLNNSTHKVRVEPTGTKNPLNTTPYYVYDFDKAVVYNGEMEYEDDSGSVTYNGNGWQHLTYTNGFSDHYVYGCENPTANCPSSAEFVFKGTNIHLLGRKGPEWGNVKVSLFPETSPNSGVFSSTPAKMLTDIDMYSSSYLVNETIAKFNGLKNQNYKVKIESAGTKNPSAISYIYDFDKAIISPSVDFEFTGTDVTFGSLKSPYAGIVDVYIDGTYNERIDLYNSSAFYFTKDYLNLSEGNHRITVEGVNEKNPSSINYAIYLDKFFVYPTISGTFQGRDFGLRIPKGPDYGLMDLYIDGVFKQTIDGYSSTFKYENLKLLNLPTGEHTFKIYVKNDKNASSTGFKQSLDYVSYNLSASYTFTGTGVEYFAIKGPNQGQVDIFLDGQLKTIVDLHSYSYLYQQKIYSVQNLTNTSHTIKIVQNGGQSQNSSDNKVTLDYFNKIN